MWNSRILAPCRTTKLKKKNEKKKKNGERNKKYNNYPFNESHNSKASAARFAVASKLAVACAC